MFHNGIRGRQLRYSSRSSRGRSGFGKKSINPSKYINTAVDAPVEAPIEISHQFSDFNLDPRLNRAIAQSGYTTPTPIQDQAILPIMEGRDVVGLANTGTGKTAAFLLPLLDRVINDPNQGVLIVVPTRELAVQIADEWKKFAAGLDLSLAVCIGGMDIRAQMNKLSRNPHFVVGTPGRLKDLVNRRAFDTEMFTNVVLDEVDRMLDIGFLPDIKFLIAHLPTVRKSYFFSATMPREVEQVMATFLTNPVTVKVATKQTSQQIHQDIVRVSPGANKIDVLADMLQQAEFEKVIVFGRTKHGINKLERHLLSRGLRVTAIHGNKTQNARQRALDDFKRGHVQALLATDVAARGIDIPKVSHVINFDEPQTYEDYIHRIGRTGRAGLVGKALTFIG
jgi:ATP-dependent RNA helicase RhlE